MAALAKMERSQLRERQAIGIATAKADGKYKGRNATDKGVVELAKKLLAEDGMTKEKVAKQLNIGVSTLYRLLKG
jgi:DNA invertase Pin-like site-specific DNA recombinase